MVDASKFKKQTSPEDLITTSVNITEAQRKFLKDEGYELSPLVRAWIEDLIEQTKKKNKKDK